MCPHTHCIDNITPTLCMTSHSPYVWHRLHYTRHHILTLWTQTTVFMSSHQLYLTLCPLYLCHHIHCINDITQTWFLRSHLLQFTTSYPLYTTWQQLYALTITAFMTSDSLHMTSPPGFMTSRPHTCDITATMFVNTCQLYLTSNTGC